MVYTGEARSAVVLVDSSLLCEVPALTILYPLQVECLDVYMPAIMLWVRYLFFWGWLVNVDSLKPQGALAQCIRVACRESQGGRY